MKNTLIALLFSVFGIGCQTFGTGETIAVVSVSSVAGVGLGYLGMYGVNRAAFASALSEHREAMQNPSGRSIATAPQPAEQTDDSDNDGIPNSHDSCPNEPRGPEQNGPRRQNWLWGCPVDLQPTEPLQ